MENKKSHYELKELFFSSFWVVIKEYGSSLSLADKETFSQLTHNLDKLIEGLFDNSYPISLDISYEIVGIDYINLNIKNTIVSGSMSKKVLGIFTAYSGNEYSYEVTVSDVSYNDNIDEPIVLGTYRYFYKGLGYQYKGADNEIKYFHYIEESVMDLLKVPEYYRKEYGPIFKLKSGFSNYNGDSVTILWSTGYYDGPLSGYCRQNNMVYQFITVEEKDYARTRLYGMKKISLYEYCLALLRRSLWVNNFKYKKLSKVVALLKDCLPLNSVLKHGVDFDGYFEY